MRHSVLSATAALSFLSLSACGMRAEREALRSCTFTPGGIETAASDDSLTVSVKIEIGNPGPGFAVLDSFSAIVSGRQSLARLSHGGTRRIAPGTTDTTRAHVRIAKRSLLATAMAISLAPPDSLRLEGTAWVPGWFGGLSPHAIHLAVPWSRVAPQLRSFAPVP